MRRKLPLKAGQSWMYFITTVCSISQRTDRKAFENALAGVSVGRSGCFHLGS